MSYTGVRHSLLYYGLLLIPILPIITGIGTNTNTDTGIGPPLMVILQPIAFYRFNHIACVIIAIGSSAINP